MVREKLSIARKSFGFRINVELAKQLKILAVSQEKAVNVILEEAIEDVLKKYSKKGK
jgi:predicted HicB family RNase H-like nuclease